MLVTTFLIIGRTTFERLYWAGRMVAFSFLYSVKTMDSRAVPDSTLSITLLAKWKRLQKPFAALAEESHENDYHSFDTTSLKETYHRDTQLQYQAVPCGVLIAQSSLVCTRQPLRRKGRQFFSHKVPGSRCPSMMKRDLLHERLIRKCGEDFWGCKRSAEYKNVR